MIDYANLPNLLLALILFAGLAGLCFGGDWLAQGAGSFALKLKINPVIVGLTIVSMATSMPEFITSMVSVGGGKPELAVGNVVGSNIANIGLILGISAILLPIQIQWRLIRWEMPILLLITLVFSFFAAPIFGSIIGRWEGVVLLAMMVAYIVLLIRQSRQDTVAQAQSAIEEIGQPVSKGWKIALLLFGGSVALGLGAELVFQSSVAIAGRMQISEAIIGLTIVAIGTSLPELAASVAATRRKQSDIVAGNIVGSNIFNMLLIGGGVAVIHEIPVDPIFFRVEFPAMLFLTFLLWGAFYTDRKVTRREGVFLLILYVSVLVLSAYSNGVFGF